MTPSKLERMVMLMIRTDADDDTDDREGDADKNADDDVRKGSKRVATS